MSTFGAVAGTVGVVGGTIPGGPDVTAPAVPSGLGATPGDEQVVLDWDDNTEPDLDRYEYRVDGGTEVSTGATSGVTVTGLTNDQSYDFEVRAVDTSENASAWSSVVSATPVEPSASDPVFVQAKSAQGANTTATVTFDSTPTEGNLLLCAVTLANTTATGDITAIGGWTQIAAIASSGLSGGDAPANMICKVFSKVAGPAESATVSTTVASGTSGHSISVCEVSDATVVDVHAEATVNDAKATTLGATTGTTTQADELAVSFLTAAGNPGTVTINDGFTQRATSGVRARVATKDLAATGAVTSSYSWVTAAGAAVAVVCVK